MAMKFKGYTPAQREMKRRMLACSCPTPKQCDGTCGACEFNRKGETMKTGRIVVYQREDKQWGFRVVAANGEIVAQSEGYKGGKRAAVKGARAVIAAIASAVPIIGA